MFDVQAEVSRKSKIRSQRSRRNQFHKEEQQSRNIAPLAINSQNTLHKNTQDIPEVSCKADGVLDA